MNMIRKFFSSNSCKRNYNKADFWARTLIRLSRPLLSDSRDFTIPHRLLYFTIRNHSTLWQRFQRTQWRLSSLSCLCDCWLQDTIWMNWMIGCKNSFTGSKTPIRRLMRKNLWVIVCIIISNSLKSKDFTTT